MSGNDEWVMKESRTHAGTFYKYNPKTGESNWLTPGDNPSPRRPLSNSGRNMQPIPPPVGGSSGSMKLTAGALGDISPTKGAGRRPITRSSRAPSHVSWGTDDTADGSECICTICECGKHKCPLHGYQKPAPFAGDSRYREDYPKHPLEGRGRKKVQKMVQPTPGDPDQFKSKYAEDYTGFVPEPPKSIKPKPATPTKVPFEGVTTNKEMLDEKPLEARAKGRPRTPPKPSAPFDGTTTNRDAHKPFEQLQVRESMAPQNRVEEPAPFEGTTQYTHDYIKLPLEDRGKKKAQSKPYDYGPPREFDTENRHAFDKKPIHYCPVLDLDAKNPSAHTGHIHYTKQKKPTRYWPAKASPRLPADNTISAVSTPTKGY